MGRAAADCLTLASSRCVLASRPNEPRLFGKLAWDAEKSVLAEGCWEARLTNRNGLTEAESS